MGTLLSSLKMLFPDGPATCQTEVVSFLMELCECGPTLLQAIADLTRQFPPELRKTRLSTLMEHVDRLTH